MSQITISPYTIRMDPSPSPFLFKNYPSTLLKYAMHYNMSTYISTHILRNILVECWDSFSIRKEKDEKGSNGEHQ